MLLQVTEDPTLMDFQGMAFAQRDSLDMLPVLQEVQLSERRMNTMREIRESADFVQRGGDDYPEMTAQLLAHMDLQVDSLETAHSWSVIAAHNMATRNIDVDPAIAAVQESLFEQHQPPCRGSHTR